MLRNAVGAPSLWGRGRGYGGRAYGGGEAQKGAPLLEHLLLCVYMCHSEPKPETNYVAGLVLVAPDEGGGGALVGENIAFSIKGSVTLVNAVSKELSSIDVDAANGGSNIILFHNVAFKII